MKKNGEKKRGDDEEIAKMKKNEEVKISRWRKTRNVHEEDKEKNNKKIKNEEEMGVKKSPKNQRTNEKVKKWRK